MPGKKDWEFPEADSDFTLIDDLDILDTADFEIIELDSKENVSNNGENSKKEDIVSILDSDSTDLEKEDIIEPSTIIDENLEQKAYTEKNVEVDTHSSEVIETDVNRKNIEDFGEENEKSTLIEEEMATVIEPSVKSSQAELESFKENLEEREITSLAEQKDGEKNQYQYHEYPLNKEGKMVTKFKQEEINNVLKSFLEVSPDFQAAAIVSSDGFVIASDLPEGSDENKLGAMSAAIISLGERASKELDKGSLETVFVEGAEGYVLLSYINEDILLVVSTNKYAKLGLVFYELSALKKTLKGLFD